jgi:dTDP-4-amino-4,6-dideoxygalactose transaminase
MHDRISKFENLNHFATIADVDSHGWPVWPAPSPNALHRLENVLHGGRWSISGFATGRPPMERIFAERFAAWNAVAYCTPTANGTSALVAALDALDIGPGDEIIVPGLTWIAPALAVLQVNATPIIVDIDPDTLSISADAIDAAITPRTRAVIVVHLYCSTADIDRILAISRRHGLALIEDCAQSHGTVWRGRKVGGWGDVGVFSMHQGKPLTCGEGGAAITNDERLFDRLQQLRANGRRYIDSPAPAGVFDLIEVGSVLGSNLALSEFQAALLLDGLESIDAQNARKAEGAAFLDCELSAISGLRPIGRSPHVSAQTYYHYLIRFEPEAFAGHQPAALAEFLTREIGCPWQPTYVPMNRHRLYNPLAQRRYAEGADRRAAIDPTRFSLPECERAHMTSLIVPHRVLLADKDKLTRIPEAFEKLKSAAPKLSR